MQASMFYDLDTLTGLLKTFRQAPDNILDGKLRIECEEFISQERTLPEIVYFLRNLVDKAVFTGGASGGFLSMLSLVLEEYPEPPEEKDARRAKLEHEV